MRIRERSELAADFRPKCGRASQPERETLLDYFCWATGCERKYAIEVL